MGSENDALAVVLIHGLISSPKAWKDFVRLAGTDPDLRSVRILPFAYSSPKLRLNPLSRIPDLDDIADSLRGYLRVEAAEFGRLVLVSHSQGGLVIQRHLARTLSRGEGLDLARIRQIVLFACPNNGAELLLSLRRAWLPHHPQDRGLRPLNSQVQDAQSRVVNQIMHAETVAPHECRIPIAVYAGASDNIVPRASAQGVFKEAGVLPGNHKTIIRPDSHDHRSYTTFKHHVLSARAVVEDAPTLSAAASATAAAVTDGPRPRPSGDAHGLRRLAAEFGWGGETVELVDFRKNLVSLTGLLDGVPPAERRVLGALLDHGTGAVSHKHWGECVYRMPLPQLQHVLNISAARLTEHLRALEGRELVRRTAQDGEAPAHAETDGRRDSMDAYVMGRLRAFCHARGVDLEGMIARLDLTALG